MARQPMTGSLRRSSKLGSVAVRGFAELGGLELADDEGGSEVIQRGASAYIPFHDEARSVCVQENTGRD